MKTVEDGMPRMRVLTAWTMLTENKEFNAPLDVIPGSHKEYVSCAGITQEKNRNIKVTHGKPGTVAFHECHLIHGSPDHISGTPRTLLMAVYNSYKNKLVKPFSGQTPRPHYLRNPDQNAVKASQE